MFEEPHRKDRLLIESALFDSLNLVERLQNTSRCILQAVPNTNHKSRLGIFYSETDFVHNTQAARIQDFQFYTRRDSPGRLAAL